MKKWTGFFLSLLLIILLFWNSGLFQDSNKPTDATEKGRIFLIQYKEGGEKKGGTDSHLIQLLKELKGTVDGWLKSLNERIEREDVTRLEVRFLEILRSILEWVKEKIDSHIESSEQEMAEQKERRWLQETRQSVPPFSESRMKEEKVFILSDTVQLEGLLSIQETLSVKGGAVLCPPHPQYGGDMHNNVITAAVQTVSQSGFSTLRFNFRGVGSSGGSYGDGIGEKEDVKAAIEYLSSRLKGSAIPLILLGYSFGAWVGLPVAVQDDRVIGMVAIAPPLEMSDFEFLKGCKKGKLIIAGNRDFFCPVPILEMWYQDLQEPKSMTIIPGADHFFFSHTHLLAQPLKEFLDSFIQS